MVLLLQHPTNRLVITNTQAACVIPADGSAGSFVNGPLTKNILAGNSFVYPIGIGTKLGHKFTVTAGGGPTTLWTADYFSPNGTAYFFNPPLQSVNTEEYWNVSAGAAKTGYVKMAWDITSALTPLMTQNGLPDMRVATYNAGNWQSVQTTISGNNDAGDVATTNTVNITPIARSFTIAPYQQLLPELHSLRPDQYAVLQVSQYNLPHFHQSL